MAEVVQVGKAGFLAARTGLGRHRNLIFCQELGFPIVMAKFWGLRNVPLPTSLSQPH
jgi:hypothetical protein